MRYSTSSEKQNHASVSKRKSNVASIFTYLSTKQADDVESGQDFNSIVKFSSKSIRYMTIFFHTEFVFKSLFKFPMKKP